MCTITGLKKHSDNWLGVSLGVTCKTDEGQKEQEGKKNKRKNSIPV